MPDKTENRARAEGLRDMLVDLQVGHDTTVAEVLVRITAALDAAEARGLERAAEVCDSLDGWRAVVVTALIARVRELESRPYPENRGQTHFGGCWEDRGHHNCAVERVQVLSRGFDQAQDLIRELHDDHALMLSIIKGAHGAIADTGTIPLGALCESADELAVAVRALTAERDRYRAALKSLAGAAAVAHNESGDSVYLRREVGRARALLTPEPEEGQT